MHGAIDPRTWWFLARASGIVAWALLTGSVVWGLTLSTRALGKRTSPAWLLDLHRHLSGLAVVFTGVHIAGLVADSFVHFGTADVLVPLASPWKPGPVAWGILSLYALVAVELTSLARRRLPKRIWRRTHYLSFPLWIMASAHFLLAGTDAKNSVLAWALVGTAVVIVFLTLLRLLATLGETTRAGAPTASAPTAAAADDPRARRAEMLARARAASGTTDGTAGSADLLPGAAAPPAPTPIDARARRAEMLARARAATQAG